MKNVCDLSDLQNFDAVRFGVEDNLYTKNPELFVFYDHGNEDRLVGYDSSPVIDLENAFRLKGRLVYTLACLAGKELGPKIIKEGGLAFWGYKDSFGFYIGDAEIAFKEQANVGIIALTQGFSLSEAVAKFIEISNYWRDYYTSGEGKSDPDSTFIAARLVNNRDILTVPRVIEKLNEIPVPPPTPSPSQPTTCPFRKLAIKLFGKLGEKISRKFGVGILSIFSGMLLSIFSPFFAFLFFFFGLSLLLLDFVERQSGG